MKKSVTIGAEQKEEVSNLLSLKASSIAPVVTIMLLALRPVAGINIDPLIALPVGRSVWRCLYASMEKHSSEYEMGCRKCRCRPQVGNRHDCWCHKTLLRGGGFSEG